MKIKEYKIKWAICKGTYKYVNKLIGQINE